MKDLGQVFSGNIHFVGTIIVSSGDDYLSTAIIEHSSQPITCSDVKGIVLAHYCFHALILSHIKFVVFSSFAVVLQRLEAVGLGISATEREIADFQQLRRGKENHVRRIMKDGID